MESVLQALIGAGLIIVAILIFRRVGADYQNRGKLTPLSSWLQVLAFGLHGLASYAFLDSQLAHIDMRSPTFPLAVALMILGVALVLTAMSRLGWGESVGRGAMGLRQSGLYRYSRNPQVVAYALVVAGYALLWPSRPGIVWVGLYFWVAHMMVRTEEEHLKGLYGEEYAEYCARTPRYLGRPR